MKNFLFISAALLIAACSNPKTEKSVAINHIYKPTYSDSLTIGNSSNALLVEQMHQAMIAKKYDEAAAFLADSVIFYLGDGTTITGKPAVLDLMKKEYAQVDIKNYSVQVNLPVVTEKGSELVLLWDNADIVTPDGKSAKGYWMEAFLFEKGKIVVMNQYEKYEKPEVK